MLTGFRDTISAPFRRAQLARGLAEGELIIEASPVTVAMTCLPQIVVPYENRELVEGKKRLIELFGFATVPSQDKDLIRQKERLIELFGPEDNDRLWVEGKNAAANLRSSLDHGTINKLYDLQKVIKDDALLTRTTEGLSELKEILFGEKYFSPSDRILLHESMCSIANTRNERYLELTKETMGTGPAFIKFNR